MTQEVIDKEKKIEVEDKNTVQEIMRKIKFLKLELKLKQEAKEGNDKEKLHASIQKFTKEFKAEQTVEARELDLLILNNEKLRKQKLADAKLKAKLIEQLNELKSDRRKKTKSGLKS